MNNTEHETTHRAERINSRFLRWLINDPSFPDNLSETGKQEVDRLRLTMYLAFHGLCLMVLLVPFSWTAVGLCLFFYLTRMFFITAFYHRYFSHKSFDAGRIVTFCMAVLGCTTGQRGPLWWASHHRQHHLTSDTGDDPHSPGTGFLNSHMLWFLRKGNFCTMQSRVRDWMKFPELRWLERFDWAPFLLFAAGCLALGNYLETSRPELQVTGMSLLVWGFLISTVLLWHGTYTINSFAHRFGSRRFATVDDSRNNFLLALLTLGEGWHNNHHRYPNSTRQGFYWWEIDISYYLIRLLCMFGIVDNLKPVPASVYREGMGK